MAGRLTGRQADSRRAVDSAGPPPSTPRLSYALGLAGRSPQELREATGMSKPYQAPLNWYTGGTADTDINETEEWLTAFEQVVEIEGRERACFLLKKLLEKGYEKDVVLPFTGNT